MMTFIIVFYWFYKPIIKIPIMAIWKTSYNIQIKIKMPNPSQEPPVSSEAPKEDLKDIDVLCIFEIKIES